jgi:hypothetical protein
MSTVPAMMIGQRHSRRSSAEMAFIQDRPPEAGEAEDAT